MATETDNASLLLYRVGPVLCCAPSLPVLAIITPPDLTRPPGTTPAAPGIFRHAGRIVRGIDLRIRFGVDEADRRHPGRTVVCDLATGSVGFWVDEIIEVIPRPEQGWGPLPALLPRGIFSRTLLLKKRIHLYAEFAALLRLPEQGYLRAYIEELQAHNQDHNQDATRQATRPSPAARTASAASAERRPPPIGTSAAMAPTPTAAVISDRTTAHQQTQTPGSSFSGSVGKARGEDQRPPRHTPAIPTAHAASVARATDHSRKSVDDIGKGSSNVTPRVVSPSPPQATARAATPQTERSKSRDTSRTKKPDHPPLSRTRATPARHTLNTLHVERPTPSAPAPMVNSQHPVASTPAASSHAGTWLLGVVLLCLVTGIGGLVWIYQHPARDDTQHTHLTAQHALQLDVQESTPAPTTTPEPEPDSLSTHEPVAPLNVTPDSDTDRDPPPTGVTVADTLIDTRHAVAPPTPASEPVSEGQVSIEKDQLGITIVIDTEPDTALFRTHTETPLPNPQPESAESNQASEETQTLPTDDETRLDTKHTSVQPKTNTPVSEPEPTANPNIMTTRDEQITHIVVKGDTLWHIAIRYVNDPYRYPELARLSNIHNPDLIYPGDRVRIIKRVKQRVTSPRATP